MTYDVSIDDEAGFAAFDVIIERWQATPRQFPYDQKGAVIPQVVIPDYIRNNKEFLFNFYFYLCLYMRGGIESLQAFKALIRMATDKPELFDPFFAQHLAPEELQPIIAIYVGWDAKAVTKFWIENSKRLVRNWQGSARTLFKGLNTYDEALRRIRNKRTKSEWKEACRVDDRGEGFMGFQPKMVSMFVYFIDWEGLLDKPFIYPTPADFHNFRFGLSLQIIVLHPQPKNLRSTEKLSEPWRDFTVRYLKARKGKVTPVELADAIWLFSLTLCGASPLTDYHEPKDKNGHGMFAEHGGLTRTSVPNFLAPRYRERLKRTCLSCPLISRCILAIPAGPYYQRRGDRAVAFGGQLYLFSRFRIEQYLQVYETTALPGNPLQDIQDLAQSSLFGD